MTDTKRAYKSFADKLRKALNELATAGTALLAAPSDTFNTVIMRNTNIFQNAISIMPSFIEEPAKKILLEEVSPKFNEFINNLEQLQAGNKQSWESSPKLSVEIGKLISKALE